MIKCLLNTITMMNVNVKIKYTRINLQQLQNTEHNIIDVTEAARFCFLSMMESACPVNYNIGLLCQYNICSINTAASCELTEIIQALKTRVIKILINLKNGMHSRIFPCFHEIFSTVILLHSFWGKGINPCFQVSYVVRMMKWLKFFTSCFTEMINVKMFIQAVTINQTIRHFDSLCFHRMFLWKFIFCDLLIVEVCDFRVHFQTIRNNKFDCFFKEANILNNINWQIYENTQIKRDHIKWKKEILLFKKKKFSLKSLDHRLASQSRGVMFSSL